MKLLVNIFLFIFITFLSTPTLVGIVDNEADTSYFYTMCEEEENHAPFNEIKSVPTNHFSIINFTSVKLVALNVLLEHDLSFDNLAHQIFSPPPNNL
ncbi:MAG: hypothetical protein ACKO8L_14370 [Flavobacterium sp.]